MPEEKDILIVDDEPIIRDILIRKLTSSGYKPVAVENAFEAFDKMREKPFPVILSDIMMPGIDGIELIKKVRVLYPDTAVVMITAVSNANAAIEALKHGASDYLIKPFNLEEIVISIKNALEALSTALDYRDNATEGHSQRVVQYSVEVGKALGLSSDELINLSRGTLLHDIGKIGVPDSVLRKPAKLTTAERVQMRKHVEYGYSMLKGIPFLKDASFLVLHHQEKYDGTGYPQGLKREQIVMGARIFALADTYDSMTTDRPYRKALADRDAEEEILRCRSSQFDPVVVDTFFRIPEDRWFKIKEDVAGLKVDNSVFRNPAPTNRNEKDPIPLMLL